MFSPEAGLDHLHVSENKAVLKLLDRIGPTPEYVIFSDFIRKINKRGKEQDRVLVVTNYAVYNLIPDSYSLKRRINLLRVCGLTASKSSSEFILHVPEEYDYHYKYADTNTLCSILATASNQLLEKQGQEGQLAVLFVDSVSLADRVVHKKLAKRQSYDDMVRRKTTLQTMAATNPFLPSPSVTAVLSHSASLSLPNSFQQSLNQRDLNNPNPNTLKPNDGWNNTVNVNKSSLSSSRPFSKSTSDLLTAKSMSVPNSPQHSSFKGLFPPGTNSNSKDSNFNLNNSNSFSSGPSTSEPLQWHQNAIFQPLTSNEMETVGTNSKNYNNNNNKPSHSRKESQNLHSHRRTPSSTPSIARSLSSGSFDSLALTTHSDNLVIPEKNTMFAPLSTLDSRSRTNSQMNNDNQVHSSRNTPVSSSLDSLHQMTSSSSNLNSINKTKPSKSRTNSSNTDISLSGIIPNGNNGNNNEMNNPHNTQSGRSRTSTRTPSFDPNATVIPAGVDANSIRLAEVTRPASRSFFRTSRSPSPAVQSSPNNSRPNSPFRSNSIRCMDEYDTGTDNNLSEADKLREREILLKRKKKLEQEEQKRAAEALEKQRAKIRKEQEEQRLAEQLLRENEQRIREHRLRMEREEAERREQEKNEALQKELLKKQQLEEKKMRAKKLINLSGTLEKEIAEQFQAAMNNNSINNNLEVLDESNQEDEIDYKHENQTKPQHHHTKSNSSINHSNNHSKANAKSSNPPPPPAMPSSSPSSSSVGSNATRKKVYPPPPPGVPPPPDAVSPHSNTYSSSNSSSYTNPLSPTTPPPPPGLSVLPWESHSSQTPQPQSQSQSQVPRPGSSGSFNPPASKSESKHLRSSSRNDANNNLTSNLNKNIPPLPPGQNNNNNNSNSNNNHHNNIPTHTRQMSKDEIRKAVPKSAPPPRPNSPPVRPNI